MDYYSIQNILEKTIHRHNNLTAFCDYFLKLFKQLDNNKINHRSNIEVKEDYLKLDLIHFNSNSIIEIKVDEYEIYIWVDSFGYSMFNISKNKSGTSIFYEDVIIFLKTAFEGGFSKQIFIENEKISKVKLIWNEKKYPDAVSMSIKNIALEKLGIKRFKLLKEIKYPTFF